MKQWLRRARGAVLMGLTWAVVWAPVGVLVGLVVDPDGSMDEMWVAIGAYPGFLVGVLFSIALSVLARRRRFDELSVGRFAAWGAAAGLLVGALPFTIGEAASQTPLWLLGAVVVGSTTALGALSAAGSLALARRAQARGRLDDGVAGARAELAGSDAPRRLDRTR